MKCIVCLEEFQGRSDARFCSPKCRKQFSRDKKEVKRDIPEEDSGTNEYKVPIPENIPVTDNDLWVEAHAMTVRHYLARGYFGGKSMKVSGVVTNRQYFPFKDIQEKYFEQLKKERDDRQNNH